jgi:hypothetical protein
MRRREFITLLGGAAAWPLAAPAQGERMRRIGVLTTQPEDDRETRSWVTAFVTRLRELGWTDGANVQIDYRWGAGDGTPCYLHPSHFLKRFWQLSSCILQLFYSGPQVAVLPP